MIIEKGIVCNQFPSSFVGDESCIQCEYYHDDNVFATNDSSNPNKIIKSIICNCEEDNDFNDIEIKPL